MNEAGLFAFAAHMIVPVHVSALRIVAPRPHVQLEKRIERKAIRRADELKVLTVERRRSAVVVLQIFLHVNDVLDTDELTLVSDWLVDQSLRIFEVDLVLLDLRAVDVVNAHRAVIGTADTAERRLVSRGTRVVYVE